LRAFCSLTKQNERINWLNFDFIDNWFDCWAKGWNLAKLWNQSCFNFFTFLFLTHSSKS